MTAFDYERADAVQQAELRGEVVPSPQEPIGRDHSLRALLNAVHDAYDRLDRFRPGTRKHSWAAWDFPKDSDRKLARALMAIDALRVVVEDEFNGVTPNNACRCKVCVECAVKP